MLDSLENLAATLVLFALVLFAIRFVLGLASAYRRWRLEPLAAGRVDPAVSREPRRQPFGPRARLEERRKRRETAAWRRINELKERKKAALGRDAEERARRTAASDQRRRNDARARCECRWGAIAPHIEKKFSRADFDRFLRSFMTDAYPADEVEERSRQLLAILDSFYEQREEPKPARRFETLEDVTTWFIEQQERIGRLPLDDQTRDEHLARLSATYAELSERMLETPR